MNQNNNLRLNKHKCLKSSFFLFGIGLLPAILLLLIVSLPLVGMADTTIRSASEIDYPPFCIVDRDGNATGFSVELMRAALGAMGRAATFRIGVWSEVKGWLEHGEIQALPLVGRTPERELIFDFSFPYMSLHGAIVVRKDTNDIRNLEDLSGKHVAVMKDDNAEEFLRRENRGIAIHTTPTFEEALQQLSYGHYDAVVIQRLVALRLIQEMGLTNLQIINKPIDGFRQDFCFAVKKDDSKMLALLNEGLALVIADGTYRHLHAKWFAAMELPTNRRIIVGGDHNYPPFEYLDEKGSPEGYNVELTRAIAQEVGLDIEIRLGPWVEILEGLKNGDIDALQGMFYSPERGLKFDFTPPHIVNNCVSVVRKGDARPPSTLSELAGKQIVVQQGDIMHDFALENGLGDQVYTVDSQEHALRELSEGIHDCAMVSRITALYWIEKKGLTNLVVGQKPLLSPEYSYVVLKNQKALLAQFSEGLRILEETGEYHRIYEKWLGVFKEKPPTFISAIRYSAMVLIPLVLILLAFFFWSWSLRKQVAKRTGELRKSEEQYRLLANNTLDVIWTTNLDLKFTYVNPACLDLVGYTPEEWIGSHLQEHCDEINFAKISRVIVDEIAKGPRSSGVIFESEIIKKNGDPIPIEIHGKVIYDENNQPLILQGVTRDISERKQAEQRFEHLNRVLRAIRDVNQLIVHERNRDILIHEACRLLVDNRGYTYAMIILTDENDRAVSWAMAGAEPVLELMKSILEKGELPHCCIRARSVNTVVLVEDRAGFCGECPVAGECPRTDSLCIRLVHENTAFGYFTVAVEHSLGSDAEEKNLFAEMSADLAYALFSFKMEEVRERSERERKSLQKQLLHAQKMEAVGRLAGGVAHDFNNMLGVIIGYSELAMEKADPNDSVYINLKEILDAATRSSQITRQLLTFARRQTINPRVLDLNEMVESMLKMLRRLLGEDIDLAWLPGMRLWQIEIDPAQLDQILANLCVNARDAITGVGKITIETDNVVFDKSYCADHIGCIPGDFVLLAVSDNGYGMDKETLENIFEPFFTTKDLSQGTGLGLATVYGIVKQNKGFINVYSEPGKGTTFRIYLPRHMGKADKIVTESTDETPLGHSETILLVEDEPAIMRMGKAMLERLGYNILAAGTPGEALRIAREHEGRILLLITDVVMPEMNGRDLADQLHKNYPDIKTLFMSGYTANVIAHHGVLKKGVQFIQKPFSITELASKVREVLEQKS